MNGLAWAQWLGRIGLAFLLVGCGVAAPTGTATPPTVIATASATPSSGPTPSSTRSIGDVMKIGPLAPLEPGTYFIDADMDPSTSLRVVYDIPAEGWSQWIGAAKFNDAGHVGVSITTVVNLVRDGCRDHSWADPPVGPSVSDLAAALVALAPFRVSAPKDVTIYGYSGKHLELTVPDLPVDGTGDHGHFIGCTDGDLKSWVAPIDTAEPGDAFYGYTGPDYREEFWILDVEGTRLMVAAEQSPGSPAEDVAELQAIVDSIRIEP